MELLLLFAFANFCFWMILRNYKEAAKSEVRVQNTGAPKEQPEQIKSSGNTTIYTRYIGLTNKQKAKIKATSDMGQYVLEYDATLDAEANHMHAAMELAHRCGWAGRWIGGRTKDGWVFVGMSKQDSIRFLLRPERVERR